jgi:hypothetical protein
MPDTEGKQSMNIHLLEKVMEDFRWGMPVRANLAIAAAAIRLRTQKFSVSATPVLRTACIVSR